MQNLSSFILVIVGLILFIGDGQAQYEAHGNISVERVRRDSKPNLFLSTGDLSAVNVSLGDSLYSRCAILTPNDKDTYTFRWIRRFPNKTVEEISSNARLLMQRIDHDQLQYPIYCQATRDRDNHTIEKEFMFRIISQANAQIIALSGAPRMGSEYVLECSANSQTGVPLSYTWYFGEREIFRGRTLRLQLDDLSKVGTYKCVIEYQDSVRGSISSDVYHPVNLTYSSGTTLELTPDGSNIMMVVPGESREIHCELDRPVSNRVEWFFDKQPLSYKLNELNSTGTLFRQDTLRLSNIVIKNIEAKHQGSYRCVYDGISKAAHLIVRASYQGMEVNPKQETVDEGGMVEFHCRVETVQDNINTLFQWYFRSRNDQRRIPLDFSGRRFVRRDDSVASRTSFISKVGVELADDGFYICVWPGQNVEAEAELIVRGSRPPPSRIHVTITPRLVRVRAHEAIHVECYAVDDYSQQPYITNLQFRLHGRNFPFDQRMISSSKAEFNVPSGLDAGYNGSEIECYANGAMDRAIIIIESTTCPTGYRRCRSNECIPAGKFCDGRFDCRDRSDEDPQYCQLCDPITKKCEYYNNQAPLVNTYMIHWQCDGEDDCGNGYDEHNCPNPMFAQCNGSMFQCTSSNQQIPLAFTCDKEQDCPYGEDEGSCSPPVVETTQIYRYPVRQGGTVTLECRVTGFPLPRVIWRFNWGCLPSESRFIVTSRAINCYQRLHTTISTLTINGVRPGDDGIYNCEGLFGIHRAMSNDYHVLIENRW